MSRPAVEVADILRKHRRPLPGQESTWLSFQQLTVLRAIARCRTAALGRAYRFMLPMRSSGHLL